MVYDLRKPNDVVNKRNLYILIFSAFIISLIATATSPMYILDEVRNAQAAREMHLQGQWVVPTFNGELRPQKPPLHYYFMRAAYSMFGINAWAARFFSAVMGLLTLMVTFFFTKKFAGKTAAFWATGALAASVHFLLEFQLSVPDPYLIFFMTAGSFSLYTFEQERKWKWLIISAVSIGLATLSKGPVAILLPALSFICFLCFTNPKRILSYHWLLYGIIVLAVAAPWFVAVHYATNGEFTRLFFFEQNLSRFSSSMEGHGGIFIIVPLFVFLGMLPFATFLPAALRPKYFKKKTFETFSFITAFVIVAFFSFSKTKLPNYPMPAYPFIAVLIGSWMSKYNVTGQKKYPFIVLLVLNILLFATAIIVLKLDKVVYNDWYAGFIFLIPIAAIIYVLVNWKKKDFYRLLWMLTCAYLLFNAAGLILAYPAIYRHNPVEKTIGLIGKDDLVYGYKLYNPAYNFRLAGTIPVLNDSLVVNNVLSNAKAKIITRQNLLPELDSTRFEVIAREQDLFERPVTVIIRGK